MMCMPLLGSFGVISTHCPIAAEVFITFASSSLSTLFSIIMQWTCHSPDSEVKASSLENAQLSLRTASPVFNLVP
jgi:hypothetical protein